jgi:hypothetical protein
LRQPRFLNSRTRANSIACPIDKKANSLPDGHTPQCFLHDLLAALHASPSHGGFFETGFVAEPCAFWTAADSPALNTEATQSMLRMKNARIAS